MSDKPNSFETIERHKKGDGSGYHVFHYTPDFHQPFYPVLGEFIFKANEALSAFRKQWMADHPDDNWAKGLEMDVLPVMSEGVVMGYLGVSEISGETYDYFPAKQVEVIP